MLGRSFGTAAVTGGAGFVGLHIVEALARAGWSVLSLDRSPPDNVARAVAERWPGQIELRRCDVGDEHELRSEFARRAVDVAIHAAAITSARPSNTLAMIDVQIRATQVLLDLARARRLGRLIVLSSAGVFRSPQTIEPLDEDYPVTLGNPYAMTKVAAERLVAFARHTEDTDAVAVRLPFVYGTYERPTASRSAMSSICSAVQLARAGRTINVNGPDVLRDWTHANDIATGIVRIAGHHGPLSPLYHLGIGSSFTVRETIATVVSVLPGSRVTWVTNVQDANVPISQANQRSALAIARARQDFDFAPEFGLEAGIRDYALGS